MDKEKIIEYTEKYIEPILPKELVRTNFFDKVVTYDKGCWCEKSTHFLK